MKLVKNFLLAVLLVSAMAVTTTAGEQNTPASVCIPSSTNSCENQVADDSETEETEDVTTVTTDSLLFEAMVAVLSVY